MFFCIMLTSVYVKLRLLSRTVTPLTVIATARSQCCCRDQSVNGSQRVTIPIRIATTTKSTSAGLPALHVVLHCLPLSKASLACC